MANTSFVQTDFRGGKWSASSQGRMHEPKYKTAMNVCLNGMPTFSGPWTRRPGFLWGGNTRLGKLARLIDCYLKFTEPFQLELTDGYLRAHVGNGNVFTSDSGVTIASISTANPAIVTVNGTLPSTWAALDTVILDLVAPSTSPILSGRQFQIQSLTTSSFALYDAMTGNSVDGSTQPYTAPTLRGEDYVNKVLELTAPWSQDMLFDIRMVQTDSTAILFHYRMQPQSLTVPPIGNFALTAQSFKDGPYQDINSTTTTLTPSGTSGSITFTASATTGINGGAGFLPGDVGRVLRFQSQQPAWASGTTYANGAYVTGSDNNIYQSQVGGNTGNDPTTDNGVHWAITSQTVVWVWGYITAVGSTTSVTVSIQPAAVTGRGPGTITGDALAGTAASSSWQLGLFSNTTGWPQGGTYHEGRLWLYGSSVTNRVDASCSNDVFNFAPSAPNGTVGDGNAISKQGNAPKINQVFWMFPSERGILMGCKDAEWLIYASNMEDPLTPTTTQLRRVSTYGCANIVSVATELTMCFVQREQQRILNYANYPYGEAAGWFADNLSLNADDICGPGIAEIRYQQEPSKFLWARMNDGSLASTTFEHPAYGKEGFNGWHTHSLGGSRTVASISTGPSSDGLTTTLYVIAYNSTTGLYEYLEFGHLFDETQADWAQNFTDGIAQPSASKERATANGDSFNGITIYGLFEVIGQTITVNMGGLDLGDFVVAGPDGHIDIPYTTTFTKSFFTGLSNGTDYGVFALDVQPADANSYTHFGAGAYNPTTTNLSDAPTTCQILYQPKKWLIAVQTDGVRLYNAETLNEITDATTAQITFNAFTGGNLCATGVACYNPNNNSLYTQMGGVSNSSPIVKIDMGTLRQTGVFGTISSSFLAGRTGFGQPGNTMISFTINNHNFVATAFLTSGAGRNGIGVIDGDSMSYIANLALSDTEAWLCPGYPNVNQWFVLGTPNYGPASTTAVNFYTMSLVVDTANFIVGASSVSTTNVGSISPSNIDATWTHFSKVIGPAFDPTDGNLLVYFTTSDSVTNKNYWAKINSANAAIIWKTATGTYGCPFSADNMSKLQMPGGIVRYNVGTTLYTLNTETGSITSVAFPGSVTISATNELFWPEKNAVISACALTFSGSPPGPYDSGTLIPLGTYLTTSNTFTGYSLLTDAAPSSNASWPPPDLYSVPVSIGANYTSAGQLLRPDYGQDAGAVAGPAFGKKRRQHWFSAAVVRSQNFNISTDNTFAASNTDTVTVMDQEENVVSQPNLYTGTLSTTMPDGYSWDSQIAWQVTRPTPLTITAIGGYIETMDK